MPRLSSNFAAAFAAIIITLVSMQTIITVPAAQPVIAAAPMLA